MPGKNGMGPMNQGPLTGRGAGWCGGNAHQTESPQQGLGFGKGRGQGCGRGGGWRHRHWNTATTSMVGRQTALGYQEPANESSSLSKQQALASAKAQLQSLEQKLNNLRARIQEIEDSATATEDANNNETPR